MPALTLYVNAISQPSRAVMWYVKKNKIEGIEVKQVDIMKQEHASEEITKLNPFQAVPFLRIDDQTLCESGAILTYLSSLVESKDGLPDAGDALAQARLTEALMMHDYMCRNITMKWIRPIVVPKAVGIKMKKEEADAVIASSAKDIKWVLDWTEKRLNNNGGTLIGGGKFSLADYLLACETTQWPAIESLLPDELKLSNFPAIQKFNESLKAMEGYDEFVAPIQMIAGIVASPWAE